MEFTHLVPAAMRPYHQSPLLHFVFLGVVLNFTQSMLTPEPGVTIDIDRQTIEALSKKWTDTHEAWPTPEQLRSLINAEVEERVLQAKAEELGLDDHDPFIRSTLIQGLRFAGMNEATEKELLQRARDLGLIDIDPLIQRYRVQTVRELWRNSGRGDSSSEHSQKEEGGSVSETAFNFELLYFETLGDAAHALKSLSEEPSQNTSRAGRSFPLGHKFRSLTQQQILTKLGHETAIMVASTPTGEWSAPASVPWGWILLRVTGSQAIAAPASTRSDLRQARREEAYKRRLAEVMQTTRIAIDWPHWKATNS